MKLPLKSAMLAFHETIAKALGQPLPEADCTGGREWEIQTPWGRLSVSAWGDDSDMIFLRFRDVNRAGNPAWGERFPDANPFSGKWNILAPGPAAAVVELYRKLDLAKQPVTA